MRGGGERDEGWRGEGRGMRGGGERDEGWRGEG